jgi:AraC-like DNA-binding protein
MTNAEPTRWQSDGIRFSREWRQPRSQGPLNACHADTLELCLIEEGSEVCDLEGRATVTPSGCYGVIPPHAVHSSWTEKQGSAQTILHVPVLTLKEAAAATGIELDFAALGVEGRRTPPELAALVSALRTHVFNAPPDSATPLLVSSLVSHLALWLVTRHAAGARLEVVTDELPAIQRVRDAEASMRERLDADHRLDVLATQAGLSRFHFLRLFKRVYGTTPHAHLLKLRVERAAAMLKATDMPVTAIAFELGFSSTSGFIGAFRQRFGVTPGQARGAHAISGTARSNLRV